jgi:hypothetical protein
MSSFRNLLNVLPARTALVRFVPLLLAALLTGCGGDDGPAQTTGPPPPPPLQVSSGLFDVTANIIFDTCNSNMTYSGTYEIQIDDLSFSMGDEWLGTWDPKTTMGVGESEHDRTTMRLCTVTTWTSVNVTFQSEDEFTGVITFRRRVDGECRTPCVTTWGIAGVRQQATP